MPAITWLALIRTARFVPQTLAFVGASLALARTVRADDAPPAVPASTTAPALVDDRPSTLDWEQGEPIPGGYTPSTEIREELVLAGAVTLSTAWVFGGFVPGSIGVACTVFSSGDTDCGLSPALFVPGIGPFIAMPFATDADGSVVGEGVAALLADGLVQSAGAVMLIVGLVKRDVLVRVDLIQGASVKWEPAPMSLGESGQGLGIIGTF